VNAQLENTSGIHWKENEKILVKGEETGEESNEK
jgi:hypothetical protein